MAPFTSNLRTFGRFFTSKAFAYATSSVDARNKSAPTATTTTTANDRNDDNGDDDDDGRDNDDQQRQHRRRRRHNIGDNPVVHESAPELSG